MIKRTLSLLSCLLLAVGFAGCSVEQTEEGELPQVDIDVEEGNMPEYDVDTADVEVGTEEKTVTVPDVDIGTQEETVTVPDVDIDMPDDDEGTRDAEEMPER